MLKANIEFRREMKKVFKTIVISLFVISNIILASGIYLTYRQHQKHQKMVKIATSKEAKEFYEEIMTKHDPKAFTEEGIIKSYNIDTKKLYHNPMGGVEVTVYINNDKQMSFQFGIIIDSSERLYSSGYVMDSKLGNLLVQEGGKLNVK